MKKYITAGLFCALVLLSGCGKSEGPSPKNPVTVTVRHTMGGSMKAVFDELLAEFNDTLGVQNGIVVKLDAVMDLPEINELFLKAAADSGTSVLPDMAVMYPAMAALMAEKGLLADITKYLSAKELARYVPGFLDEGRLGVKDGPLYTLPIAKSTEVLYVNTTAFKRFAAGYAARYNESAPELSALASFEGILDTAEKYYRFTDAETPAIPKDGKTFFHFDSVFNFFMIGFEQAGDHFFSGGTLNRRSPVFERLKDYWHQAVVRGLMPAYGGYGNFLAESGDVVCTLGSSSGGMYYTRPGEFDVLPYPVLADGKLIALQRGGGMGIFKSTAQREKAAAVFLAWFTAPEQNLRFTAATGYMPVESAAFNRAMVSGIQFANHLVEKTFSAMVQMQKTYTFFVPPVFKGYDEVQSSFKTEMLQAAEAGRAEFLIQSAPVSPGP